MTTTTLSYLVVIALLTGIMALVYAVWRDRAQPIVYRRLGEMSKRLTQLSLRMVELEITLAEYRVGTAKLVAQIIQLGHTPAWQPPIRATALERGDSILVHLYELIEGTFNMEEMNTLIFSIGYRPEQIEGDTAEVRARSLVEFAARRGELPMLVQRAREMRPTVRGWPGAAALQMQVFGGDAYV